MNLENIPGGFFQILSSKHNNYYLKAILILYDYITGSEVSVRRELIILQLQDLLNENSFFDDDQKATISKKEFPAFLLRRLKEAGWIDEEIDNNYQKNITFTRLGYRFSRLFSELNEELNQIEALPEVDYQSYIYTIYLYLRDYRQLEGKIVIERVFWEMNQLRLLLKELASSIKTYLQRSLAQIELEAILKLHFDDYRQTIGQSYHLLKTSDNVAKFKIFIIDAIETILKDQEYLEKTASAMILETKILDQSFFISALRSKMLETLSFFNLELDEIIKEIDYRHAEYIKSTINRFKYLSSHSQDVEGQINTILKHFVKEIQMGRMLEGTGNELSDQLTDMTIAQFVDERSFYKMRNKGVEFVPKRLNDEEGDHSDKIEELIHRIKKRQTKAKASESVKGLLEDKEQISAKAIVIENEEQLIELINLTIYGKSSGSGYDIELLDKYIGNEKVTFKDFIIRRK